jgi:hypothetical protein
MVKIYQENFIFISNWKCLAHICLLLTLYSPSRTAYIDEYLQTQSLELLEPTANVWTINFCQMSQDGGKLRCRIAQVPLYIKSWNKF